MQQSLINQLIWNLLQQKATKMGCISSAQAGHPKKGKVKRQNVKQIEPALYKSKIDKSYNSKIITPRTAELPSVQKVQNPSVPKIKKTTSAEFLTQYEITSTLIESTKLEGPKLITNKITGGVSVLRVYSVERVSEQRLKQYHKLIKFELYTDEQENYLLIDQYCSGPTICQLFDFMSPEYEQNLSVEEKKPKQFQIHQMLLQVYDLIERFHSNQVYLGNLNLFSFKRVSEFGEEVKLVDYCFENRNGNGSQSGSDVDKMGHAHSNSFQADWQFYGYLLQFYLSGKSPVFISHKMQYVQNDPTNPYMTIISSLLKGRQVYRKQIQNIQYDRIKIRNQHVLLGYKFCNDVIKLVKARKRRAKHKAVYYSQEIFDFYYERNKKQQENGSDDDMWKLGNFYNPQQHILLTDENLHRMETDRILNHIQTYIDRLNSQCEEHFINYSISAQNYRKLKQVFLITDKKQQFDEFKQLIPQIK